MKNKNPTIAEISKYHNVSIQRIKQGAVWLEIPIVDGRISNECVDGMPTQANNAANFGMLLGVVSRALDPNTPA